MELAEWESETFVAVSPCLALYWVSEACKPVVAEVSIAVSQSFVFGDWHWSQVVLASLLTEVESSTLSGLAVVAAVVCLMGHIHLEVLMDEMAC